MLICTDGSEAAERATRWGGEVAAALPADVTLLGIKESSGHSEEILGALRRGQQLLENRKVAVEAVTKAGDPIEEIVKRTEESAYDLVIIGAARKGHHGAFSMSSKAYRIVKLIKPPVLIVMGEGSGLKRILVCSGGKGYIESAFQLIAGIAQGAQASVSLLHVTVQAPAIYSDLQDPEMNLEAILNSNSELGRNLRHERQSLAALGIATEVRLRRGFVLDEIFKEIREGRYDLIVAGSSLSLGPLRTYVLGDVTREIVNRADCPVLVARHTMKPPNLKERVRDFLHSFSMRNPGPPPSNPGENPKPAP